MKNSLVKYLDYEAKEGKPDEQQLFTQFKVIQGFDSMIKDGTLANKDEAELEVMTPQ